MKAKMCRIALEYGLDNNDTFLIAIKSLLETYAGNFLL